MFNTYSKLKYQILVVCGIFFIVGLALADSVQFNVSTNGGTSTITTTALVDNCRFPITLQSSSGLIRSETEAINIERGSYSTIFTFNHPVEINRPEIKLRRTVSGCKAEIEILELQQPVSQFSLIVTPYIDDISSEPITLWEHFSLGPLPSESDAQSEDELSEEIPSGNSDSESTNEIPFCSDEKVKEILNKVGVLSEEIRIHNNRLNDLTRQRNDRDESAWQNASALVESRTVISRLEGELAVWENELQELELQINKNQADLDKERQLYKTLQGGYVDNQNVRVVENDEPLDNIGSGVTLSLDGGNTWLILVGEKGLRQFINKIRQDKTKGRQLHAQGQQVKKIKSLVFALISKKETAINAINSINTSLQNSREDESRYENELNKLKELRASIVSDQVDVSQKLSSLKNQLQEEELLLDGCESFAGQKTSFMGDMLQKMAQFFRPLVLAYGGS